MIKKDVVRTKDYSYRLKGNNYEYIPDKFKPCTYSTRHTTGEVVGALFEF